MALAGGELYEQGLEREAAGDIPGAFEAFRLSARADPRVAAPYVGLARILSLNHQRAEALACLEQAADREPRNPAIRILLGRTLSQDGRLDEAREQFTRALELGDPSGGAAIGLGGVHEDQGDRRAAADVYSRLLSRDPANPEALAGLLAVAEGEVLEGALQMGGARLEGAADPQDAVIGYALGKALARLGRPDAAFGAWAAANRLRRKAAGAFDRQGFNARIDRLTEIFSPAFFTERRGWGDPSARPVFIVGLPRSGTTLTEQVLASHPEAHGAGELDFLTDLATGAPDRLGRPDPPWPDAALELQPAHIDAIAKDYLRRVDALAPGSALRVVDKQPLNFWHLGLVALAFPNARVIHCERDLRDNGLSIFAENFTPEQRWAADLGDIAHYWRGYRRLMRHWRTTDALRSLDVAYENLVGDLEGQARRLLDFAGLAWDPSVLRFHEQDRAIQTPSRWQVRTPLYTSSSGRWRDYERHIAPLIAAHD